MQSSSLDEWIESITQHRGKTRHHRCRAQDTAEETRHHRCRAQNTDEETRHHRCRAQNTDTKAQNTDTKAQGANTQSYKERQNGKTKSICR